MDCCEKCCYKISITDFKYFYFQIQLFFWWGKNYSVSPLYKTMGWGPAAPCFLRPLRSLTCLAEPSNNSNL
jgi:hypothetical protein